MTIDISQYDYSIDMNATCAFSLFFRVDFFHVVAFKSEQDDRELTWLCHELERYLIRSHQSSIVESRVDNAIRRNDHIEVIFHDVFRLKSTDLTIFESNFKSLKSALERIKSIFRVFKAHSKTFRFQFINVSSHLEDYKLIYEATNQKIHVKDKSEHCNLIIDEQRSCSIMQHYQYAMNYTVRLVFSVKAQWNFLFTRLNKQSR